MMTRRVSLALTALALAACAHPVGESLRDGEEASSIPDGLEVVYDDHTPRWGGERITLRGDGAYWLQRFPPAIGGEAEVEPATRISGQVSEEQVREVIALLVSLEAWEQGPDSTTDPLNDARASLSIRTASGESSIWEWVEDLEDHDRLIRIKRELVGLSVGLAREGADETAGGETPAESTSDLPPEERTDSDAPRPRITGRGIVQPRR